MLPLVQQRGGGVERRRARGCTCPSPSSTRAAWRSRWRPAATRFGAGIAGHARCSSRSTSACARCTATRRAFACERWTPAAASPAAARRIERAARARRFRTRRRRRADDRHASSPRTSPSSPPSCARQPAAALAWACQRSSPMPWTASSARRGGNAARRTSCSSTSRCPRLPAWTSRASPAARCHVVFVTAYDQHAVQRFRAGSRRLRPEADLDRAPARDRAARCARGWARRRPASPTCSRLMRRARRRRRGYLRWINASRGAERPARDHRRGLLLPRRQQVHAVVSADDEALIRKPMKRARPRTRPRGLLADPSRRVVNANAIALAHRKLNGQFELRLKARQGDAGRQRGLRLSLSPDVGRPCARAASRSLLPRSRTGSLAQDDPGGLERVGDRRLARARAWTAEDGAAGADHHAARRSRAAAPTNVEQLLDRISANFGGQHRGDRAWATPTRPGLSARVACAGSATARRWCCSTAAGWPTTHSPAPAARPSTCT